METSPITFRKRIWATWFLLGAGGLFLCVAITLLPYFQPNAPSYIFLSIPCAIALIAFWGFVSDIYRINVFEDHIEIQKLYLTRRIDYCEVAEVAWHENEQSVTLIGSKFRAPIYFQYFLDGDRLCALLTEKLRNVPVPHEIKLNGFFSPILYILGPIVSIVLLLVLVSNPLFELFTWLIVGLTLVPFLILYVMSSGISEVTSQSVRQDPRLGKKKELLYSQIEGITIHREPDQQVEKLCITGEGTDIWFDARFTPRYSQVRDLVLRYASCPIETKES